MLTWACSAFFRFRFFMGLRHKWIDSSLFFWVFAAEGDSNSIDKNSFARKNIPCNIELLWNCECEIIEIFATNAILMVWDVARTHVPELTVPLHCFVHTTYTVWCIYPELECSSIHLNSNHVIWILSLK